MGRRRGRRRARAEFVELCVGRPHAYAPVLPTQCMHFVHSPMPFLFGVHVMPKDLPKGVVIVNLENNEVHPACNVHVS